MLGRVLWVCVAIPFWNVQVAQAQDTEAPRSTVALAVGGGRLLKLDRPASTVFVAEPQIADIQTPSANRLFVFGKKPGRTTLFALNSAGNQVAS